MTYTQQTQDYEQPTEQELLLWLRLAHSPGISASSAQQLLQRFQSPEKIFSADRAALKSAGVQPRLRNAIQTSSEQLTALQTTTLRWLEKPHRYVVSSLDPRYPESLSSIPSPPVLLYVEGDVDLLTRPGVAFVGSRKATPPALALTQKLSGELAARGLSIISGLARGVDGAAHQGALAQNGWTLAVTGNGLDSVYPRCHKTMAAEIASAGAIVSEFPLGAPPAGHHFPRRNRIISGLSLGVVVVEAALRSGSLSTARHALEQGREVMAIPGSVNNPLSRGCHALLKSGAALVECADDIVAEIAAQIDMDTLLASGSTRHEVAQDQMADPQSVLLLAKMGYEPTSVDRLIVASGIPASEILTTLLRMELAGQVAVDSSGRYTRCKA